MKLSLIINANFIYELETDIGKACILKGINCKKQKILTATFNQRLNGIHDCKAVAEPDIDN